MRYLSVQLHNVCDLIKDDGLPGVGMLRLPAAILDAVNPGARTMARMGGGCEIRGLLAEGGEARVVLQVLDDNSTPPVVTVYHGCFCAQSVVLGKEPTEIVIKHPATFELMDRIARTDRHPFDPRLVRVRLPPIHTSRVLSVSGALSQPTAEVQPGKRLLCYGSSITHGACAIAPEGTYAAEAARRLGWDHFNLGFGGAAQMERAIAEHIASRQDWDVATFEMGINVRGWPVDQFRAAVDTFVRTVAMARPGTPIVCIDMFTYSGDFIDHAPKAGPFRQAVAEVVQRLAMPGVIHLDGRKLLTDPAGLRTDLVHPSDTGMQEMGIRLADAIRGALP